MTMHETRRVVTVVLVLLAVIDMAAIGVLLSPLAKSRQRRTEDLREMQQQYKDKEREVAPVRGMDVKITNATGDIASFYQQRLPGQYSQIDEALGKAAQTSGVQLLNITFKSDKKRMEDLQQVAITMTISGPYVSDVKFINAVEREHVFFVINSVTLQGSQGGIQLLVNAETYFKTGAA